MNKEFIHPFKGFNGRVPSTCLIKMFDDDGETFICFINLNNGTSVTNASEQLATEIVNEYNLDPDECRFFETYQEYNYETFDEVSYTWKDFTTDPKFKRGIAYDAKWRPALEEIKAIFTE